MTDITCRDPTTNSSGNLGTKTATFNVAAGEDVTCTFTNTKNGSVTIKKVMVGGTGTFTFTGAPAGTISANNGTITQSVAPGSYSSTETVPAGWALTGIVCDDGDSAGNTGNATATFNLSAGENVTCTFTNTKNGSITIKKVMVGGTGSFTYTSTETVPAGWALTDIVCSDDDSAGDKSNGVATFNVGAGENVTCTFTNTKNGSVTIKKVMVGGTGTFTFTGSPAGTISADNGTITQSVVPGTYTSTETAPAGWALTSIVCDDANSAGNTGNATATFIVSAGENVTCTYTNTKLPRLTVTKSVVNTGGWTKVITDFTFKIDSTTVTSG